MFVNIVLFCSGIVFIFLIGAIALINFFYNTYQGQSGELFKPIKIKYTALFLLVSLSAIYLLTDRNLNQQTELLKSELAIMSQSMTSLKHYRVDVGFLPNDPTYLKIINTEINWQKSSEQYFEDIYTMRLNSEGKVIFIADSETDYDHNSKFEGDRESRTPIGEIYEKKLPDLDKAFALQEFTYTKSFYTDKWGSWISAYYPLYDSDQKFEGLIGVDISSLTVASELIFPNVLLVLGLLSVYVTFLLYKKNQMANLLLNENLKSNLFQSEKNVTYQKQFLAVMSHEIRTPLNAIIGSLQLIDSNKLDTDGTENLNIARESSHILADVVGNILDYSKIQSAKIELDRSEISLNKILNQMSYLFRNQLTAKNLNLDIKIDPAVVDCSYGLDEVRFRQILMNFISNAIKFTSVGTISVSVAPIKIEQLFSILEFRISDTGIGISPENQKKLFQAFRQADSTITRKYGGTGLGLVIAKNLIEAMGGHVYFDSILGQGTTFVFTLKVENINKKIQTLPIENETKVSILNKYSPLKILIVDDVQLNQIVLQKTLQKMGCACDVATNGQEAVDKHSTQKYDIIFMDCQMPVLDGLQATKVIRRIEKENQNVHPVTIIALTANAATEDKNNCIAAGMNQFISKPFNLNQIENALQVAAEQTDIFSKRIA